MTIELSEEQKSVCDKVVKWYNNGYDPYITIGGYAGTGKTTLISFLADYIEKKRGYKPKNKNNKFKVAFCAYTGKAASVLKKKLKGVIETESVKYTYSKSKKGVVRAQPESNLIGTIHSLMYRPVTRMNSQGKKVISHWEKVDDLQYVDLIIIDEASMVNHDIWRDLLSYDVPIIAVGDHGQLPPIGSKFNLMEKPILTLKKIHRQAESNPIIQLSQDIRKYGEIHVPLPTLDNKEVFGMNWQNQQCRDVFNSITFDKDVICLCGFNKSRVKLNTHIRKNIGFEVEDIYPGERVICLRNNHEMGVMNGQLGNVVWSLPFEKELSTMTVQMDDDEENYYDCLVNTDCFGQESYNDIFDHTHDEYKSAIKRSKCSQVDFFDYGYCTTVHKSQGSEWNRVILFVQRNSYQNDDDYKRWLYTAATRAKEKLFVVYDFF
jgi:exodeoxyribonuclease-5